MLRTWIIGCFAITLALPFQTDAESIASRIDALIAKQASQLAPPADDAEFLRRVYLDFAGEIPTAGEARNFLSDTRDDKRQKLIDRLMAGPRFAEHLADRLHVMFMERRGEDPAWRTYLENAIQTNKAWDVMARELLNPPHDQADLHGAYYFMSKRLEKYGQNPTDYPGLTRDVGRMFLGVDLQCAQCHKHLTIKDYKQKDFQGLFIAYQNLKLQNPNDQVKVKWVSENLLNEEIEFVSVFRDYKHTTGPRVPFGEAVAVPQYEGDEAWTVVADRKKKIIGQPKFSPLKELADRIATRDNPAFARNMVNRMWFLFMGRGLVEPLDLFHSDNPPSHPELLDELATAFEAQDYDLQWLIRELCMSQTYQRSSRIAGELPPEESFALAIERPIAAEALLRSLLIATGERERVTALKKDDDDETAEGFTLEEMKKQVHRAFANVAREPELDVQPSLKGALFLRNNEALLWLLERREGNLVDRLAALESADTLAEELYLSILTRMPESAEREEVANWLNKNPDRDAAIGQLAWALLASAEFSVNH